MKFTLEIELGNDAMRTYPDLRRALEYARQTMVGTQVSAKLPMNGLSLKEIQLMRKILKSMPGSIRHTDLMQQLKEAQEAK